VSFCGHGAGERADGEPFHGASCTLAQGTAVGDF